jgi:hypothetical protein
MRAQEFIIEAPFRPGSKPHQWADLYVGDWHLMIADHIFDRGNGRHDGRHEDTYSAVKKIPSVAGYLNKMEVNQVVWVNDLEAGVSIMLQKQTGEKVKVPSMVEGLAAPKGRTPTIDFPKTVPTYIVRPGKLGGFMDMGRAWGKIKPDVPPLKNPVIPPGSMKGGGSGGGSFTGRMGGGGGSGGSSRIDTIHNLNPGKLPIYETVIDHR